MIRRFTNMLGVATIATLVGACVVEAPPANQTGGGSSTTINHGGMVQNNCASAVAARVGVSPNDVVVTNTTISEGTGNTVVYVGVPGGKADWVCEARSNGTVLNVFYGAEG